MSGFALGKHFAPFAITRLLIKLAGRLILSVRPFPIDRVNQTIEQIGTPAYMLAPGPFQHCLVPGFRRGWRASSQLPG